MAEIPVEKKSGSSWLWILLALLAIALLAWWLLDDDGDEVVEYTGEETAMIEPADTVDTAAMGAAAGAFAIGESVNMENVRVTSLAGDMAFNIEQNGEQMLVVFDQVPTPGTPTEGELDINPGSMVNITGEVRAPDATLPQTVSADIPAGTERFIYATNVEMVN